MRWLAYSLCLGLSGVAALLYQTAWTRAFALVLGASDLAVATVLAAFMGGLALGAWIVRRALPRLYHPVRTYALLEGSIALSALLWVPGCLWLSNSVMLRFFGHQPQLPAADGSWQLPFYLLVAFVTLALPTAMMGAALPLLMRVTTHDEEQIGPRAGTLYAWNTAGAVVGALTGAFVLLPALGLRATQWCAAALNLAVCGIALLWLRGGERAVSSGPAVPDAKPGTSAIDPSVSRAPTLPGRHIILPLMTCSGAVAFAHEVLWTRLLQRVVGGSLASFGLMLATFLLGIAVGGAAGTRWARDARSASRAWALAQLGIAAGAGLAWTLLQAWNPADTGFLLRSVEAGLVLLPMTIAIGTTYPLAVRILSTSVEDAAASSARVYAWNTLGAIVGALVTGLVLLPALRYEGMLAVTIVVCALLALAAVRWQWQAPWSERWPWIAAPLCAIALVMWLQPGVPEHLLRLSPVRAVGGSIDFYAAGRSADVVVARERSALSLLSNGLPEAAIPYKGAVPPVSVEGWMGAITPLIRPGSSRVLVVGLGGGNIINAVPASIGTIDVLELEPRIIDANQHMHAARWRDPLSDPRVHIILNDARSALTLSDARYDAVVSQPSHPWTAGAAHLYTREFLQQARAHLQPGGLFVEWMSVQFIDENLLRSMLATLRSVFPEVRMYRPTPSMLMLVASDDPIEPELDLARLRHQMNDAGLDMARLRLGQPESLLRALALDANGVRAVAANAPLITDDTNRLATNRVWEQHAGLTPAAVSVLVAPYDPLTHADSFVYRKLRDGLSFSYLWSDAMLQAREDATVPDRMLGMAQALGDGAPSAWIRYQTAMYAGHVDEGRALLTEARVRWPQDYELAFAVGEAALASGAALAAGPPPTTEAGMVLAAAVAARDQHWQEVANMDAALAHVAPMVPWARLAAQMRTEWRARVTNADLRQTLGEAGIGIADATIPINPDPNWFSLRALSAAGTDEPEVELESISEYAELSQAGLAHASAAERAGMRANLVMFAGRLTALEHEPTVDGRRLEAVRQQVEAMQQAMQ